MAVKEVHNFKIIYINKKKFGVKNSSSSLIMSFASILEN